MRNGLLALSATNLVFFRRWAQLLPGGHDYFLGAPRAPVTYLSLMALILGVSLFLWGVHFLAQRSTRPWPRIVVRGAFVAVAIIGLFGVLSEGWVLVGRPDAGPWFAAAVVLFLTGFVSWLTWKHRGWHRRVAPIAVGTILLFAPLAPVLFAQGVYRAVATDAASEPFEVDLTGHQATEHLPGRVVWIVLDELDQRLTFEQRPPGYPMPELERLRNESLYATHAYAPNGQTLFSIPSMLSGVRVVRAEPYAASGLRLQMEGSQQAGEFKDLDTVFHDVRSAGGNTAVVGTYHPYCRLFSQQLTDCAFAAHYADEGATFAVAVEAHLMSITRTIPGDFVQSLMYGPMGMREHVSLERQQREADKYNAMEPAAIGATANGAFDFVFVHLNVPHPTGMINAARGFYDSTTGSFVTGANVTYFDNLVLADQAVGKMRAAMEASGVWENTTVIVTSDHGYRGAMWGTSPATQRFDGLLEEPSDHRVVFLLKPPSGSSLSSPSSAPAGSAPSGPPLGSVPVVYDEPFNVVLMRELVMQGLSGSLRSPDDAAQWIEANRAMGEAPYYRYR